MREADVEIQLAVLAVPMLLELNLCGVAHEGGKADFALNVHCLRVVLQLAPLASLCLLRKISRPRSGRLLSIAASHGAGKNARMDFELKSGRQRHNQSTVYSEKGQLHYGS